MELFKDFHDACMQSIINAFCDDHDIPRSLFFIRSERPWLDPSRSVGVACGDEHIKAGQPVYLTDNGKVTAHPIQKEEETFEDFTDRMSNKLASELGLPEDKVTITSHCIEEGTTMIYFASVEEANHWIRNQSTGNINDGTIKIHKLNQKEKQMKTHKELLKLTKAQLIDLYYETQLDASIAKDEIKELKMRIESKNKMFEGALSDLRKEESLVESFIDVVKALD